jgi:hypothetical protein
MLPFDLKVGIGVLEIGDKMLLIHLLKHRKEKMDLKLVHS